MGERAPRKHVRGRPMPRPLYKLDKHDRELINGYANFVENYKGYSIYCCYAPRYVAVCNGTTLVNDSFEGLIDTIAD